MLKRAFRGRPARSLYPPSSSAIFLIALNIKTLFFVLGVEVKSTFELPSEEWSKGNPPWTADLGVMSRDANKAVPPAKG
ncbi:hypothetical protein [Yersinia bercovieri]|uniref:Uncharacterized protein n=1 Tax=Yersinia bercovieri TaxID=634 RepID=A0A2G4U671_YERBE|nr:hypothetical protein [Yersinia bercovieri]PHZ28831.1 hypothetical protein CS533_02205 [Yersinia bercovieri]QKJ05444.1 hypothetical protein HRK25_03105 [Yersinia bercovieri ATCC 43970]